MDQYDILKVIGEGSFGRALLVCHRSSTQKYVMKEVRLPKTSSAIQNSRQEAILLAKMKHHNIVTFRESFEEDGHLYIVMEYCDGGDLMETIKRQKGKLLPEQQILHWFVQLCLAVQHIHEKRVLHRDIKSKNVFLTQTGKIKLGDFGSARLLTSPMAYACTYVGTPYYVPPEIWENIPYNNKSDIWSLGCVLYEISTLKHPFQAGSWKNLILKICQGSYSPLPAQYSYELRSLIKQMFRKDPRHRPSTNTILKRRLLSRYVTLTKVTDDQSINCQEKEVNPQPTYGHTELHEDPSELKHASNISSSTPNRRQWAKKPSDTVLDMLENASLLSSSIAAENSNDGSVIKYGLNAQRKKWKKESTETVLNILKNADLTMAFETYTIHKPKSSEGWLRGPLSNVTQTPDATDGGAEEEITVDPERFQPRSDDEDTDFEEDDSDPDWISALTEIIKGTV
ncbi:serine/threonine-protein kinase Nek3 [Bombina bombina]|uniref:serine/threonine-protein kinase Nek3 n=1 Tax=Bombina bombina TaxID=8345 RepID=UPI00235AF4EE|nr:serine/threonine-protein kinase Nek3 [Bombina bombina]